MHSSRMRTARALTVFPGGGGGRCLVSGVDAWQPPQCEQTDACENITFDRFATQAAINSPLQILEIM